MRKIYLLRILKCVLFVGIMMVIYQKLDYVVTDDTESLTRITLHDFYEEDHIDTIFIGASHVFRGMDVNILSEELGEEVFCLSTSSQDVLGSYTLLKEAISRYDIKNVYFELSPAKFAWEEVPGTRTYIITDYLKNMALKTELILKEFQADEYLISFSTLRRNFNILEPLADFSEIMRSKDSVYEAYETPVERYVLDYKGRGNWVLDTQLDADGILVSDSSASFDNVGVEEIESDALEYLRKMIALCERNQIKFTAFMMPYPDIYLKQYSNYEEFTQYMKLYVQEQGGGWIDLNLVKPEYLDLVDSDFLDLDHLNAVGGEKASKFMAEYMRNSSGEYFLSSLEEHFGDDKRVFGMTYSLQYETEHGILDQYEEAEEVQNIIVTIRPVVQEYKELSWRLFETDEDELENRIIVKELEPENDNSFKIPFEDGKKIFEVQLYDDETDEMIYKALLKNMR